MDKILSREQQLNPCDIENFKKVVAMSIKLFQGINQDLFLSPYSVIPIISQSLGLNTPLMGSGDSPYSIISIIFELQKKERLLKDIFQLPLAEKRKIIDEIYEMIAPALLKEEDEYVNLLIETKYRMPLEDKRRQSVKFRSALKEKFAILYPLIHGLQSKNADFGYIAHYGYLEDLYREYPFLEKLPISVAQEWRKHSFPIVNEVILKNFPNKGLRIKREIKGWVLFITNYTRELLEDGRLRKEKILKAAELAQKLGAKIIGMGGLVASFAQGGYWLSDKISDVGFTTGHAYTIGNILEIMERGTEKVGLNIKKSTFAIVGAAGSIGSGCAKLLTDKSPHKMILIDLNTFSAYQKIEELIKYVKKINPNIKMLFSNSLRSLKQADVIIAATNSPTSIILSKYLKKGAIVIDDSFPKNVSRKILKQRKDIILLEGGIMQLPISIDILCARNMPDLMDVPLTRIISCKETYGCVAEILVLALCGHRKNYGLGYSSPQLAKDITSRAKRLHFSSAPLQCFDTVVNNERFKTVSEIIKNRRWR